MNRPEYCIEEMPKMGVILRNSKNPERADCKVDDWKAQQRRLLICEPSIMATNLTIIAGKANDLTLCEVMITAAGETLIVIIPFKLLIL